MECWGYFPVTHWKFLMKFPEAAGNGVIRKKGDSPNQMMRDFPTFHTFQISLTTGESENSFFVDIELGWLLGRLSMFGMFGIYQPAVLGDSPATLWKIFDNFSNMMENVTVPALYRLLTEEFECDYGSHKETRTRCEHHHSFQLLSLYWTNPSRQLMNNNNSNLWKPHLTLSYWFTFVLSLLHLDQ